MLVFTHLLDIVLFFPNKNSTPNKKNDSIGEKKRKARLITGNGLSCTVTILSGVS